MRVNENIRFKFYYTAGAGVENSLVSLKPTLPRCNRLSPVRIFFGLIAASG